MRLGPRFAAAPDQQGGASERNTADDLAKRVRDSSQGPGGTGGAWDIAAATEVDQEAVLGRRSEHRPRYLCNDSARVLVSAAGQSRHGDDA